MKSHKVESCLVAVSFVGGLLCAPARASAAEALDGKKIYEAKCASCHGKDGKGKPAMVKALKLEKAELLDLSQPASLAKSHEEWVKITTKGEKKMPAYEKKLKAEEIEAVTKYVRELVSEK